MLILCAPVFLCILSQVWNLSKSPVSCLASTAAQAGARPGPGIDSKISLLGD